MMFNGFTDIKNWNWNIGFLGALASCIGEQWFINTAGTFLTQLKNVFQINCVRMGLQYNKWNCDWSPH